MISIANIYIKYGERVLLDYVNFVIKPKDKIGLVGRNGAGKSTMLKLIAKYQSADEGGISYPTNATIGFLHQELNISKGRTVMEEAESAFEHLKKIEARLEILNQEVETRTDYESDSYAKMLDELVDLNEQLHHQGSQDKAGVIEQTLKGLGFKQSDFPRLTDEFSGGWQMRIILAKMLLQKPDYLLLDEPTNHLDIESIIWLESFLKVYQGCVIVISHDRQFLNNVTKRTIEIELGKVYDYQGNYDTYMNIRSERLEKQMAAHKNQTRVIAQKEKIINKFMAKASKTKLAQSMKKQLDKMERIELDVADTAAMNLRFPTAPRSGQVVLEIKKLQKKYGENLVLNDIDFKMDRGEKVSFVGQNGQGKTTLAKIIVNELRHTKGELNLGHNVKIGYYAQNQSETLYLKNTVLETMEAHSPPEKRTSLRSILGAFMFSGEDSDKKVSVLSGGERARLALACLLLKPFNLLVLDEPTNHLDLISKDVLKQAIKNYDGTLIVVSHDRDFLEGLTEKTIEFRDKKLHTHLGDINYFLNQRKMENMRQVELSKSSHAGVAAKKTKNDNTLSKEDFEKKRRFQKDVQNAERKIDKLEKLIKRQEKEMEADGFYSQADVQTKLDAYAQSKKDLDSAMEAWEIATDGMEAFDG